jgi:hypothetical protein
MIGQFKLFSSDAVDNMLCFPSATPPCIAIDHRVIEADKSKMWQMTLNMYVRAGKRCPSTAGDDSWQRTTHLSRTMAESRSVQAAWEWR